MKRVYIIMALSSIILGCATVNVENLEIAEINIELLDKKGNSVSSVAPGLKYKLNITVVDTKGNIIERPDLDSFDIKSIHFDYKKNLIFKSSLEARSFTFRQLNSPEYIFSISVKNNSFPITFFKYRVNWDSNLEIDFSGEDGEEGEEGKDGADGSSFSINLDGQDGEDGEEGEDGTDGKDTRFVIVSYDTSDTKLGLESLILFYEIDSSTYFLLSPNNNITINSSGGNGGDGGKGGDGGEGGEKEETSTDSFSSTEEGDQGDPGNGGDGGHGGDGGNVTIYTAKSENSFNISIKNNGGLPGSGGKPGDGKFFGRHGFSGSMGAKGKVETLKLSDAEILTILSGIQEKDFNVDKVLF